MAQRLAPPRNGNLFDAWSIVHLFFGVVFGWVLSPALAIFLLVLWEPIEIFILSPLLFKVGVIFGRESFRNSMSDIFFDIVGVAIGFLLVRNLG
jgi:hypothetical protein